MQALNTEHRTLPHAGSSSFPAWLLAALLVALFAAGAARAAVSATATPRELFVGENGQLEIASDEGMPKSVQLPHVEGVDWVAGPSTSVQKSFVNGHYTSRASVIYAFRCPKAGTFTVPPIVVVIGGNAVKTEALTVVAKDRQYSAGTGRKLGTEDLFFAEVHVGSGQSSPPAVYVGEEIPLRVDVYAWENLQPNFTYPEPALDNATLKDFSPVNAQNPGFAPAGVQRRIIGEVAYQYVSFETAVIPLAVGDLAGKFVVRCQLSYPRENTRRDRPAPFDDEFFNGFFGRQRSAEVRQQVVSLPPVKVLALPTPPADAGAYIGLLGDWDLDFAAAPGEVHVGEPLTLTLRVRGKGNLETLKPPALNPPGFRAYEPEVKKNPPPGDVRAEVTWVLIPLETTAQPPTLSLSTFDVAKGAYRPHTYTADVRILPAAAGTVPSTAVFTQAAPEVPQVPDRQRLAASSILYIKSSPGRFVARPLWRNALAPGLAMTLTGLAAYAGLALAARRRERASGDDAYRRRRQALAMRRRLFRAVRAAAPGEEAVVVRETVVPYVSALLGLPPGTTASELAQALDGRDPELATMLRTAGYGDFAPGAAGPIDTRKLLARLGRLAALLVLASAAALLAPPAAAAEPVPVGRLAGPDFESAKAAYDRGEYPRAGELFAALARVDGDNPNLLYNQANCAFQLGQPTKALALYERVRRLAPRDSDNLENLNFVRGQLGLARIDKPQNPRQLLVHMRDKLRPDEWLLLGAAAVLFGGVGAGWCRWRRWRQWPVVAMSGAVLVVALLAANRQLAGTFRPGGHGIVASAKVTAHQLPNADSAKTDFILPAGEAVVIEETRTDWYRIRLDAAEGWVRRDGIEPVW